MAELVPIIESGDLKNVVLQNDIQMLAAQAAAFDGMHLEIGSNGWVILNRKVDNDLIDQDTNNANVALTATVESAAICSLNITEDIADGYGTFALSFLYTAPTSPSTVTIRVYVDGSLQTTFVAEMELNTPSRTLTYSGTIAGPASAGQSVTFTVESNIASTVSGATYESVLRVTNLRNYDHAQLLNRDDPNAHPQYVHAAYGGIRKATDTNYGTVGDGVWTLVDNWDSGAVVSPIGVTQDVANSGLRVNTQGVFSFTGALTISFTDVNQGRRFGVRLWNQTKSTGGREVEYFVGRNQDGVNIIQGGLFVEIGATEVGDLFQLQVAGMGDSFADVTVLDGLFSVQKLSGYFA